MNRPKWSMVLPAVLVLVASGWAGSGEAQVPDWMDKVDPWVLSTAETKGTTEFLVVLREQAPLHDASSLATKEEKGELVARTLRETAERTQAPVLDELKSLGAEFRPYWIANMIWVRGDLEVARIMAERPDVMRVSANPTVKLKKVPSDPAAGSEEPTTIEWGINKTGAPQAWALGFRGSGVVVAGQDTGYDWEHAALKLKYRGWNSTTSTASHDYNWHDSIHSGGGVCGANSAEPCDDDSHGTHTMGTMVGDDGAGNQVGMAPAAKWIGCRNMDQGNGTPTTYAECFQWFVAPTNLAGLNPDPTKAPHVINNSWGCPVSEGCTDPLVLKTVVENARAAGIVVVVSAGNAGSSCGSVNDPPAIYDASFSVGATNSSDGIASFSSRGPVTLDGSNRAKPDISAPGVSVRSSVPGGGYATYDGTSMAGPHVAGHVALLLSAMPQWKGQVDLVEERIEHSAVPLTSGENCGVPGSQIPNNTFGWGRINALASVSITDLGIEIVDSPDPVAVGGTLTYIVRANNNAGVIPATGAVATISLSPKVSFVSAPAECSHASGVVTCAFGTIVKGVMPTKSIVVTVNEGGAIQTSGSITGTLYDLNPGNNQVFVTTFAGSGADLRLTMNKAWDPVLAGVPFTYELTAQNLGPSAAGTVTVTDTLPAGAAFSSASAGCAHASGTVTCNLGALSGGASSMVSITVIPTGTVSVTNAAVVASDVVDPSPANNTASTTTGIVAAEPVGLEADVHAGGGVGSDANGVFEPGERVVVSPSWRNPSGGAAALTGTASSFGPVSVTGGTYTIADATGSYGTLGAGASGDCQDGSGDAYELEVPVPDVRPAAHWDAQVTETLSTGAAATWTLHLGDSFTDVPRDYFAYRFVETILHNGVTAGCGGNSFCPESSLTRAEMAVFVLKGKHGAGWAPPASTGSVFTDVPIDFWAGDFIEELAAEGVTSGCGSGRYCPDNRITRAEMAVFLLKALHGPAWVPAESTGTIFTDVPVDYWAGDFIEELAAAGITSGCGGGSFCPESLVTRAEMAVFLTQTFAMKLY